MMEVKETESVLCFLNAKVGLLYNIDNVNGELFYYEVKINENLMFSNNLITFYPTEEVSLENFEKLKEALSDLEKEKREKDIDGDIKVNLFFLKYK